MPFTLKKRTNHIMLLLSDNKNESFVGPKHIIAITLHLSVTYTLIPLGTVRHKARGETQINKVSARIHAYGLRHTIE